MQNRSKIIIISCILLLGSNIFVGGASAKLGKNFSFDSVIVDAVEKRQKKTVEMLLSEGVNPDEQGRFETTALHRAAFNGYPELVSILLSKGADANLRDFGGASPLHMAARKGNIEVIRELIASGADLDMQDNEGFTPLQRAIANDNTAVGVFLLEAGSEHDSISDGGNTPLIQAVRKSNKAIVEELIFLGADKYQRNSSGINALEYARKQGDEDIIKLLEQDASDIRRKRALRGSNIVVVERAQQLPPFLKGSKVSKVNPSSSKDFLPDYEVPKVKYREAVKDGSLPWLQAGSGNQVSAATTHAGVRNLNTSASRGEGTFSVKPISVPLGGILSSMEDAPDLRIRAVKSSIPNMPIVETEDVLVADADITDKQVSDFLGSDAGYDNSNAINKFDFPITNRGNVANGSAAGIPNNGYGRTVKSNSGELFSDVKLKSTSVRNNDNVMLTNTPSISGVKGEYFTTPVEGIKVIRNQPVSNGFVGGVTQPYQDGNKIVGDSVSGNDNIINISRQLHKDQVEVDLLRVKKSVSAVRKEDNNFLAPSFPPKKYVESKRLNKNEVDYSDVNFASLPSSLRIKYLKNNKANRAVASGQKVSRGLSKNYQLDMPNSKLSSSAGSGSAALISVKPVMINEPKVDKARFTNNAKLDDINVGGYTSMPAVKVEPVVIENNANIATKNNDSAVRQEGINSVGFIEQKASQLLSEKTKHIDLSGKSGQSVANYNKGSLINSIETFYNGERLEGDKYDLSSLQKRRAENINLKLSGDVLRAQPLERKEVKPVGSVASNIINLDSTPKINRRLPKSQIYREIFAKKNIGKKVSNAVNHVNFNSHQNMGGKYNNLLSKKADVKPQIEKTVRVNSINKIPANTDFSTSRKLPKSMLYRQAMSSKSSAFAGVRNLKRRASNDMMRKLEVVEVKERLSDRVTFKNQRDNSSGSGDSNARELLSWEGFSNKDVDELYNQVVLGGGASSNDNVEKVNSPLRVDKFPDGKMAKPRYDSESDIIISPAVKAVPVQISSMKTLKPAIVKEEKKAPKNNAVSKKDVPQKQLVDDVIVEAVKDPTPSLSTSVGNGLPSLLKRADVVKSPNATVKGGNVSSGSVKPLVDIPAKNLDTGFKPTPIENTGHSSVIGSFASTDDAVSYFNSISSRLGFAYNHDIVKSSDDGKYYIALGNLKSPSVSEKICKAYASDYVTCGRNYNSEKFDVLKSKKVYSILGEFKSSDDAKLHFFKNIASKSINYKIAKAGSSNIYLLQLGPLTDGVEAKKLCKDITGIDKKCKITVK